MDNLRYLGRRVRLVSVLILALSVAVAAAYAIAGTDPPEPTDPQPETGDVDPALEGSMSVFDNPADPAPVGGGDYVSTVVKDIGPSEGAFGLNRSLARFTRSIVIRPINDDGTYDPPIAKPIHVVPGNDWVCLVGEPTGTMCAEIDEAAHGTFGWGRCGNVPDGKVAIYGLIPDLSGSATFTLASGGTQAADIQNNVLYQNFDEGDLPTRLDWTPTGGSAETMDWEFPPSTTAPVCG